jgi:hypothetical protein
MTAVFSKKFCGFVVRKQKFSEGCTSGYHDDSDDVIVLKDKVIIVF